MVPAMRALAIWGLSRSISSSTGSLFQAIGKPELSTKLQLLRFLILGALIYPFTILLGILGTSLAVVLSALFVDPIAVYWALKAVHCNVFKFGKAIILPLIQTIIMLSILFPLKMLLFNSDKLSCFLLISGIGVLIYVLIAKIFELRF